MRIRIGKTQHQKLLTDLGDRLGGTPKDGLEYVLDTWLIEGKPVADAATPGTAQAPASDGKGEDDGDLESLVDWG